MKSSPVLRMGMAAVMYLLLIWGYLSLSTPQWYAVFTALVMSSMLLFWVSEAAEDGLDELTETRSEMSENNDSYSYPANVPSISASVTKLDALKLDLVQQYAQFGRDQCALNCKSLGYWHRNGDSSGR